MKVLLHSNAPWMPSGYGQQVGLFAPRLAEHTDLAISAFTGLAFGSVAYEGIEVFGGSGLGGFGDDVILGQADAHFGDPSDGLVITLIDVQALDPRPWKQLNLASWIPVDHDPVLLPAKSFIAETGAVPIAMSRFGADQLAEFDPLYVPHGVDAEVFRPQPQDQARRATGIPQEAFVVGIVATNHTVPSRKALPQAIEAFAAFLERHDDAYLYLHTELESRYAGVDLPLLMHMLGLPAERVGVVDQFRYVQRPHSPGELANLYSSFDVLLNPSMGEGFGLTVLEAQACGVPAIVTDFTAMSEVCGAGWKCIDNRRFWTAQGSWQALPSTEEIVEHLEDCYRMDRESRARLAVEAREHALGYEVGRVVDQHWLPALAELERRFSDRLPAG